MTETPETPDPNPQQSAAVKQLRQQRAKHLYKEIWKAARFNGLSGALAQADKTEEEYLPDVLETSCPPQWREIIKPMFNDLDASQRRFALALLISYWMLGFKAQTGER